MYESLSNIQNMLGVEEYYCHFYKGWSHYLDDGVTPNKKDNDSIFNEMMHHPTWKISTPNYKNNIIKYRDSF